MKVSFKCRFLGIFAQSSIRVSDIHCRYRYHLGFKPVIDFGPPGLVCATARNSDIGTRVARHYRSTSGITSLRVSYKDCNVHDFYRCRRRSKPVIDSRRLLRPGLCGFERSKQRNGIARHGASPVGLNHGAIGFKNHSKIGTCTWCQGIRSAFPFSTV